MFSHKCYVNLQGEDTYSLLLPSEMETCTAFSSCSLSIEYRQYSHTENKQTEGSR